MPKICPLIKKACVQHDCEFWVHLLGMDPQTGQQKDEFGCTVRWLPILLTENAAQVRKAAASTDKVATQIQRSRAEFLGALPEEARERLLTSDIKLLK